MDDAVGATLKELLTPSIREELLDDPRRLAELVRERLGTDRRREASFLNTVMQEGVPKRLLAMPTASLTSAMIANYARKVSEDTGLKEDVARAAIEAWSVGLGLRESVDRPRPDLASKPESDQKAVAPEASEHRFAGEGPTIRHHEVVSAGPGIREIRLIGILMMFCGAAALLFSRLFFSGGDVLDRALPIFVMAAANIYVGLALVLIGHSPPAVRDLGVTAVGLGGATTPRQIRRIAIAVSALDAVILCPLVIVAFQALGGTAPLQTLEMLLTLGIFLGALLFPATTLRLYRWNASTPVAAMLNLLDPTAIVLLVRGLFGLWVLVMLALLVRDSFFHLAGGWRLSQLPLHLVMMFMSVAIFFNSARFAPGAVIAAVCFVSALLHAGEIWMGHIVLWQFELLSEIGMLGDVVVLGILLFDYMRRRNDVAQAV